jgi:hypothetical protein
MIFSAVVELDVYSGQANPRWKLDDKICQDVLEEISHLATESTKVPKPAPLGYRGLSVLMDIAPSGEHEEFYVGGGYVFLRHEGTESVRIDDNRRIEQKLLASGRRTPDKKLGALVSQILQTLGFQGAGILRNAMLTRFQQLIVAIASVMFALSRSLNSLFSAS